MRYKSLFGIRIERKHSIEYKKRLTTVVAKRQLD